MKKLITIIIIIIAFTQIRLQAQTYKLTYEPKGKIVEFYLDSVKYFTDYEAIIKETTDFMNGIGLKVRKIKIDSLDDKIKNGNDTIIIKNDRILIKCVYSAKDAYCGDECIFQFVSGVDNLIRINKVKILDKHGNIVKKVYFKRQKTDDIRYYNREIINKATNDILDKIKYYDFSLGSDIITPEIDTH